MMQSVTVQELKLCSLKSQEFQYCSLVQLGLSNLVECLCSLVPRPFYASGACWEKEKGLYQSFEHVGKKYVHSL